MNKGLIFTLNLLEHKEIQLENNQTKNSWLHLDYKNPDTKLWLLEESGCQKMFVTLFWIQILPTDLFSKKMDFSLFLEH